MSLKLPELLPLDGASLMPILFAFAIAFSVLIFVPHAPEGFSMLLCITAALLLTGLLFLLAARLLGFWKKSQDK